MGMLFRWKIIAYIGWIVPFAAGVWLCFCPESPVYLINNNKEEEALKVLKRLTVDEESATQGKECFQSSINEHLILILHF